MRTLAIGWVVTFFLFAIVGCSSTESEQDAAGLTETYTVDILGDQSMHDQADAPSADSGDTQRNDQTDELADSEDGATTDAAEISSPLGTCDNPIEIADLPFVEDFSNAGLDSSFEQSLCDSSSTLGGDVIYSLDAVSDERFAISITTEDGAEIGVSVVEECHADATCIVGTDANGGAELIAPSEATYFLVVDTPSDDVDFQLSVTTTDVCVGQLCSSHGTCHNVGGEPFCDCTDSGYVIGFDPTECVAPVLAVVRGESALINGLSTIEAGTVAADGIGAAVGDPVVIRVSNLGEPELVVDFDPLGGDNPGDFHLETTDFVSPIATDAVSEFSVWLDPVTPGAKSATVTLVTNDPDATTFVLTLTGQATDVTPPVPGASGVLTATFASPDAVNVEWTAAEDNFSPVGSLEYLAVTSDTNNIGTVELALANGTNILEWSSYSGLAATDGLTEGETYWFNVLVRDEAGNSAAYAPASETIPDQTAPVPDGIPAVPDQTSLTATIDWNPAGDNVSEATDLRYLVMVSTSNNIEGVTEALANGTVVFDWAYNTTEATISGLQPSTRHYFTVLVKDEAENIGAYLMVSRVLPPPENCWAILEAGNSVGNGEYAVNPTGTSELTVYCDMDAGGWTLVVVVSPNNRNHIETIEMTPSQLLSLNEGKLSDDQINDLFAAGQHQFRWEIFYDDDVAIHEWEPASCVWSSTANACTNPCSPQTCPYAYPPIGLYLSLSSEIGHTFSWASGGCNGDPSPYTGNRDWHGNECDLSDPLSGRLWVR